VKVAEFSEYEQLVAAVFHTPHGQRLLDEWRKEFLEAPVMSDTPERTAYNVGQLEFVQNLADIDRKLKEETDG
jgi:hypothetical protein